MKDDFDLSKKVMSAAFSVHNTLGFGFFEKVYKNALAIELKKNGLEVMIDYKIPVFYKEEIVGEYYADFVVNKVLIIELKSVETIRPIHEVQLVNYLKASKIELGLLINFGYHVEIRRRILTQPGF